MEEAGRRWRDRYELIDLVSETPASRLWRAYDNRLRRTVGLRVVAEDWPRLETVRQAAVTAASITDRRFANVIDVLGHDPGDELVIITEWLPALSLPEVLPEPMTAHGAAHTVWQAAGAIAAAHEAGVTHGRLRPASLMLLPDGGVRIRGHGVDAAIYGFEPDLEPVEADIHGLGSLLYACLTRRWPFPGEVGLPTAPYVDGRPVRPSRISADVPEQLCEFIERCWRGQYRSAADAAAALNDHVIALAAGPRGEVLARRRRRVLVGGLTGAMAGVAVVMSLADAANRTGGPVTAQPRAQGAASLVPAVPPGERRLPIVAATDFDPFGVDGENPEQTRDAIDKDAYTAWTTVTYYDPYLGGKPGVGLVVDLGAPRPVRSVDLKLIGANSDFAILLGNTLRPNPAKYRTFVEVTGAGRRILLRSPRPMTGRYVVVWFTRLPWIDGGYRGGVRSIVVRSG